MIAIDAVSNSVDSAKSRMLSVVSGVTAPEIATVGAVSAADSTVSQRHGGRGAVARPRSGM